MWRVPGVASYDNFRLLSCGLSTAPGSQSDSISGVVKSRVPGGLSFDEEVPNDVICVCLY